MDRKESNRTWGGLKISNDVVFITAIFSFFIIIGTLLPFINAEFKSSIDNHSSVEYNTNLSDTAYHELTSAVNNGDVTTFNILGSIGKIFFFTFGELPLLLDLLLFIPRTILVLLIYRQLRGGNG